MNQDTYATPEEIAAAFRLIADEIDPPQKKSAKRRVPDVPAPRPSFRSLLLARREAQGQEAAGASGDGQVEHRPPIRPKRRR
jgi:hypothetical protein